MLRRLHSLRILPVALVLAASLVGAAGRPTATMEFDDASGDAIRSDGLGAYVGTYSGRNGSFSLATGEDSIFFDFSNAYALDVVTPFGDAGDSGWLSGVQLTVGYLEGDPGTTSRTTALFEFVAPAPDGTGPTDWQLLVVLDLDRRDTNNDGSTDTILLRTPDPEPYVYYADLAWRTEPVQEPVSAPRRGPPYKDDGWRLAGRFDMPWGAAIQR